MNRIMEDQNDQEIRIVMGSGEEDSIREVYEASRNGSIQTLKRLIEDDPNLIQRILTQIPLLHLSISHGHLEFTRLLLDHNKPELAAEVDAFQRTPDLHLASANGDVEMVRALLEKNTSACLVYDKNDLITLHHLEGVKLLVETLMKHDGEDFLNTVDDMGNTVLDMSMKLRRSEMVGYLLSIPKVKIRTSMTNSAAQKTKAIRTKKKTRRRWKVWRKNLTYKGDWIQEVQGTMMLVATVIATVAFEGGINPPGGIWQQDTLYNFKNYVNLNDQYDQTYLYSNHRNGTIFPAGTPIMAYQQRSNYLVYLIANMVSFLASVSVILLIISRFPLKNRVGSWVLVLAMCAAVFFLVLGYLQGVVMVNLLYITHDIPTYKVYLSATLFWLGVVGLVGLFHIIRFLVWMVKTLLCTFTSKLKSHSFNRLSG